MQHAWNRAGTLTYKLLKDVEKYLDYIVSVVDV
jgi:hypothetical protein